MLNNVWVFAICLATFPGSIPVTSETTGLLRNIKNNTVPSIFMNKDHLQDRRIKLQTQFDSTTEQIANLQAEQNRLQGEYRLLGDLLDELDKPAEPTKKKDS